MSAWTPSIFVCEKLQVCGHTHEEWNNQKLSLDLICNLNVKFFQAMKNVSNTLTDNMIFL